MGKKADPAEGLEPDITTVEDVKAREEEQLKYFGGDPIDDDDDDDLAKADRGNNILPDELLEDRGDEIEKEEDEPEDEDDEAGDEADADEPDDDDDEPDDDAEDEASDDGDQEDSDGEEEESKPDPQRVPLSRFNEINERRKTAERELEQLRSQQTAKEDVKKETYDFDRAEEEYMDLLLDGKTKEATAKRREIRSAEQELFTQSAKEQTVSEVTQQQDLSTLTALSNEAESLYPIFNEGHPDYNPRVAQKVVTYMKGYLADGQSASEAFVSGLADVIDQFDLETKYGLKETEVEPVVTPTKKKGAPINKTKEKLAVAKKQATPAAIAGEGSADRGAAVPNIEDMSDEEFDALPESTRARMRGDML